MLQRTLFEKQNIDLSSAPWTMHEFFAGSGLVAYGLKGMFAPIWANDISEQKAAVYEANFGCEHFEQVLWAVFMRPEADWYGNGCAY